MQVRGEPRGCPDPPLIPRGPLWPLWLLTGWRLPSSLHPAEGPRLCGRCPGPAPLSPPHPLWSWTQLHRRGFLTFHLEGGAPQPPLCSTKPTVPHPFPRRVLFHRGWPPYHGPRRTQPACPQSVLRAPAVLRGQAAGLVTAIFVAMGSLTPELASQDGSCFSTSDGGSQGCR